MFPFKAPYFYKAGYLHSGVRAGTPRSAGVRPPVLPADFVAARDRELARVSSELHDELGQDLSLLKARVRQIRKKLGSRLPSLADEVDGALVYLDEIIDSVRRLCRDTSPRIVEDLGLAPALKSLVLDFGKRSGIETTLHLSGLDHRLPASDENNCYRIVQEALTNAGKHAGARTVVVSAGPKDGRLEFTIEDNGSGFDLEKRGKGASPEGLGLMIMAERARMLGGSLDLRSRKGKGTSISFTVSLEDS